DTPRVRHAPGSLWRTRPVPQFLGFRVLGTWTGRVRPLARVSAAQVAWRRRTSCAVRVHGPRVTVIVLRRRGGSGQPDLVAIRPEATPKAHRCVGPERAGELGFGA